MANSDASYNLDNFWDCTCNGNENGDTFVNYWALSGQCCNHRRFTIWLVFNMLFIIFLFAFCLVYRKEKRSRERKFLDFNERAVSRENETQFNNHSKSNLKLGDSFSVSEAGSYRNMD